MTYPDQQSTAVERKFQAERIRKMRKIERERNASVIFFCAAVVFFAVQFFRGQAFV